MFVNCVAVGEHWFSVSQDIVNFFSALLIDSCTDRPNKAEDEPFLNVEQEISFIFLITLLET